MICRLYMDLEAARNLKIAHAVASTYMTTDPVSTRSIIRDAVRLPIGAGEHRELS